MQLLEKRFVLIAQSLDLILQLDDQFLTWCEGAPQSDSFPVKAVTPPGDRHSTKDQEKQDET